MQSAFLRMPHGRSSYASRGSLKLKGFIETSHVDFNNKVVLDVGASHGGFVQTALINGASRIYAVDIGKGLLDWRLRNMPEITVMEGVNARDLTAEMFDPVPQIGLIDVSFISLKTVLPVVFSIAAETVIALVKPQFEASYRETSKGKGVIRDAEVTGRVIKEVKEETEHPDWDFIGCYPSAIKGTEGNQEYFIYYARI